MNTKQVLYNALQGQLEIKKQAYDTYHETTTQPAFHNLITEIRTFLSSIAPINDSMALELNNRSLRVKTNDNYSGHIELTLNQPYGDSKKWVDLEWNGSQYNLIGKSDKLNLINILHSFAHNLKSIEDKFINDWKVRYDDIWDADHKVQKEHTDLQNALNTLSNEIQNDYTEAMKEIGFEIKQFKSHYDLDWDYDKNDNNKRVYKIVKSSKSIKVQYGRSQYENVYVDGFKVLGKKGNKYNIEIYRNGTPNKTFNVLEKKFESFIDDVANWEYKQADKRKTEVEKSFAERTK